MRRCLLPTLVVSGWARHNNLLQDRIWRPRDTAWHIMVQYRSESADTACSVESLALDAGSMSGLATISISRRFARIGAHAAGVLAVSNNSDLI